MKKITYIFKKGKYTGFFTTAKFFTNQGLIFNY